jgi:hypothetical protein
VFIASDCLDLGSDDPPPTKELKEVTDYWYSSVKELMTGYDNPHHEISGAPTPIPENTA